MGKCTTLDITFMIIVQPSNVATARVNWTNNKEVVSDLVNVAELIFLFSVRKYVLHVLK